VYLVSSGIESGSDSRVCQGVLSCSSGCLSMRGGEVTMLEYVEDAGSAGRFIWF